MTAPAPTIDETTWIIIPAYNEASMIGSVVAPLADLSCSIAIVDDCSTDLTYSEALKTRAHVLRHPVNLGQGAALQTGITYALSQGAKYIVTFDADGQHSVEDIGKLLEPLRSGAYDIVLGSRFIEGATAENMPSHRSFILRLATRFTKLTTGLALTDTHNGMRAFTAEVARQIKISQNRMAHASEILSEIGRLRLRYCEVPVHIKYTEYSLKKGQRMSDSLNILWESFTGALRR